MIPVKYVLFSHYAKNDGADCKKWKDNNETQFNNLEGVRYLVNHLRGLQELLTSPAYEGLLILFYAPGYSFTTFLKGIADGATRDQLLEDDEIRFANAVSVYLSSELQQYGDLSYRVRFITPLDIYDLFVNLNQSDADKLRVRFVGPTDPLHYDAPKIVEAIARLRLLGTGIPVLRLDHDVLFREDNGSESVVADLGLFKAIISCLKAYQLRTDETRVATFLFSASYDYNNQSLFDPDNNEKFDDWSGAFATRVYPALPVDKKKARKAQSGLNGYNWRKYAREIFDTDLACEFYGFDDIDLNTRRVSGIGKIGAHPIVSVISGAMLCLSDGAILDLPPFSNFGLNVSWIDDHLKYCLHRELRHLTSFPLPEEPLLSRAKIDRIMVPKDRPEVNNLPFYVLGIYLPTLLWGTVMDAWITPDPLIKFRYEDLDEEHIKQDWQRLTRQGTSTAILSRTLHNALKAGTFGEGDETELRRNLKIAAFNRITQVRQQWASLNNSEKETFASIWAKGEVETYFQARYFPNIRSKCLGMVASRVPLTTQLTEDNINPSLFNDLRDLIEDAIKYIHWTLEWPRIVQVLRSVERGILKTDLSWEPGSIMP